MHATEFFIMVLYFFITITPPVHAESSSKDEERYEKQLEDQLRRLKYFQSNETMENYPSSQEYIKSLQEYNKLLNDAAAKVPKHNSNGFSREPLNMSPPEKRMWRHSADLKSLEGQMRAKMPEGASHFANLVSNLRTAPSENRGTILKESLSDPKLRKEIQQTPTADFNELLGSLFPQASQKQNKEMLSYVKQYLKGGDLESARTELMGKIDQDPEGGTSYLPQFQALEAVSAPLK